MNNRVSLAKSKLGEIFDQQTATRAHTVTAVFTVMITVITHAAEG